MQSLKISFKSAVYKILILSVIVGSIVPRKLLIIAFCRTVLKKLLVITYAIK